MRVLASCGSLLLVDKGVDDPEADAWTFDVETADLQGPMRLGTIATFLPWDANHAWLDKHRADVETYLVQFFGTQLKHGEHDQSEHGNWATGRTSESIRNPADRAERAARKLSTVVGNDLAKGVTEEAIAKATAALEAEGIGPEKIRENIETLLAQNVEGAVAEGDEWYGTAADVADGIAKANGVDFETAAAVLAATSARMEWDTKLGKEIPGPGVGLKRSNQRAAMQALAVLTGKVPPSEITISERGIEGARTWESFVAKHAEQFEQDADVAAESLASIKPDFGKPVALDKLDPRLLGYFHPGFKGLMPNHVINATNAFRNGPDALSGYKVRSFYSNIAGDDEAVTIDSLMVEAMRGETGLSGKQHDKYLGSAARYTAVANVVREAARKVGISPRELQARVWLSWRKTHPREKKGRRRKPVDDVRQAALFAKKAASEPWDEETQAVAWDYFRRMHARWAGLPIDGFEETLGPWTPLDNKVMFEYLGPRAKKKDYDPSQERDELGRWSGAGGVPPSRSFGESGEQREVKLHFGENDKWTGSVDVDPRSPKFREIAKKIEGHTRAAIDRAADAGFPLPKSVRMVDSSGFKQPDTIARYDVGSDSILFNADRMETFEFDAIRARDTGWWAAPDASGAIVHELAHAAHAKSNNQWFARAERDPRLRLMDPGVRAEIRGKVSEYAEQGDIGEFVAEVATGMAHGKNYPERVMDIYKWYGGPPVKRKKALLRRRIFRKDFDPNQPRDEGGRWTSTGSGGGVETAGGTVPGGYGAAYDAMARTAREQTMPTMTPEAFKAQQTKYEEQRKAVDQNIADKREASADAREKLEALVKAASPKLDDGEAAMLAQMLDRSPVLEVPREGTTTSEWTDEQVAEIETAMKDLRTAENDATEAENGRAKALDALDFEQGTDYWHQYYKENPEQFETEMDKMRGGWRHIGGDGPQRYRWAAALAFGMDKDEEGWVAWDHDGTVTGHKGPVPFEAMKNPGEIMRFSGLMREQYVDTQAELESNRADIEEQASAKGDGPSGFADEDEAKAEFEKTEEFKAGLDKAIDEKFDRMDRWEASVALTDTAHLEQAEAWGREHIDLVANAAGVPEPSGVDVWKESMSHASNVIPARAESWISEAMSRTEGVLDREGQESLNNHVAEIREAAERWSDANAKLEAAGDTAGQAALQELDYARSQAAHDMHSAGQLLAEDVGRVIDASPRPTEVADLEQATREFVTVHAPFAWAKNTTEGEAAIKNEMAKTYNWQSNSALSEKFTSFIDEHGGINEPEVDPDTAFHGFADEDEAKQAWYDSSEYSDWQSSVEQEAIDNLSMSDKVDLLSKKGREEGLQWAYDNFEEVAKYGDEEIPDGQTIFGEEVRTFSNASRDPTNTFKVMENYVTERLEGHPDELEEAKGIMAGMASAVEEASARAQAANSLLDQREDLRMSAFDAAFASEGEAGDAVENTLPQWGRDVLGSPSATDFEKRQVGQLLLEGMEGRLRNSSEAFEHGYLSKFPAPVVALYEQHVSLLTEESKERAALGRVARELNESRSEVSEIVGRVIDSDPTDDENDTLTNRRDDIISEHGLEAFIAVGDGDGYWKDNFFEDFNAEEYSSSDDAYQEWLDEQGPDKTEGGGQMSEQEGTRGRKVNFEIDDDGQIELTRGIHTSWENYTPNFAESYSFSPRVAGMFGHNKKTHAVPTDRVLTFQGGKHWRTTRTGMGQKELEFIVMPRAPKWRADALERKRRLEKAKKGEAVE